MAIVRYSMDGRHAREMAHDPPVAPPAIDILVDRVATAIKQKPEVLVELPDYEQVVTLSPDGTVRATASGKHSHVTLDSAFDEPLRHLGAAIVLLHNHPGGNSLSGADLGQLSKAGLAAVVAVGHDGSVFGASAGPGFDADRFETSQYPIAVREVLRQLRLQCPAARVELHVFDGQIEHLVATALHKANIVRYAARFGGTRRTGDSRSRIVAGHVTASASATLLAETRKRQAGPLAGSGLAK